MADIGEITFDLIYLTFIWIIVALMYQKRKKVQQDEWSIASKMLIGFFLLALGDTGHVGFRLVAFASGGLEQNAMLIGLGALSTAITIGILYMILLEIWRIHFNKPKNTLFYGLLGVGIIRYVIFIFPQNEWGSIIAPLEWSLARNIPLMIQGIGVAILILIEARKQDDKTFRNLAYCIFISYMFYLPVILFVQITPMIGMLMIPKTIAYMIMAWIIYKSYFK